MLDLVIPCDFFPEGGSNRGVELDPSPPLCCFLGSRSDLDLVTMGLDSLEAGADFTTPLISRPGVESRLGVPVVCVVVLEPPYTSFGIRERPLIAAISILLLWV